MADSAAAAIAAAAEKGWVEGLEGSGRHSWSPSTISFLVSFSDGERAGQFSRGARLERLAGARRDAWLKVERVRRMEKKKVREGRILKGWEGRLLWGCEIVVPGRSDGEGWKWKERGELKKLMKSEVEGGTKATLTTVENVFLSGSQLLL